MRNDIKMIELLRCSLAVIVLIAGIISQADAYDERGSQNCRGDSQAAPSAQRADENQIAGASESSVGIPSNVSAAQSGPTVPSSKPRSVNLSWNAAIPASNSPEDAIKGYNLYRREPGKKYEKINTDLIGGTNCVDYLVKIGQTYYYEAKAVSAKGEVSKPSNETKAIIPPR